MYKIDYFSHNWLGLSLHNNSVDSNLSHVNGVVYDLGCGIRPYENEILEIAEKYIGVDWSNTLHGAHADIIADLNQPIAIDDEVADTVVSFQVMEHLCEPQTMLNETFRILKTGGTVFLTVPWQWWIHESPYDFYRYTPYGLRHMFKKAGFVDVQIEAQGGFFAMWILKLNYFTTRLVRGPLLCRWVIKAALIPFWFLGQKTAPYLDKLDRHWELETQAFSLVAKKPPLK